MLEKKLAKKYVILKLVNKTNIHKLPLHMQTFLTQIVVCHEFHFMVYHNIVANLNLHTLIVCHLLLLQCIFNHHHIVQNYFCFIFVPKKMDGGVF
jgi:hypothetical protein